MYYIVNIEGKYLCGRFSPDLWTYDLEKAIGFELEQDAKLYSWWREIKDRVTVEFIGVTSHG